MAKVTELEIIQIVSSTARIHSQYFLGLFLHPLLSHNVQETSFNCPDPFAILRLKDKGLVILEGSYKVKVWSIADKC